MIAPAKYRKHQLNAARYTEAILLCLFPLLQFLLLLKNTHATPQLTASSDPLADGKAYIDGYYSRDVQKGVGTDINQLTGNHTVEVRSGDKSYRKSVVVKAGEIHEVVIVPEVASQKPKTEPEPVVEIPKEKPAHPQAQTPKYQLRKEPMTVSDNDALNVFKLKVSDGFMETYRIYSE